MTDYQVAIPSFRRPTRCVRTVENLAVGGVPLDRVTVFLSDPHEETTYRRALPGPVSIAAGAPGIVGNRNTITAHYPDGLNVVSVDDDITRILGLRKGKLRPFTDLHSFFEQAWAIAGTRLWGVNPTGNGFYMSAGPVVKTGLKFTIGCFHGYTVDRSLPLLTAETKEDYERTILYYEADGAVARFDWLTTNNMYAATEGGLGTDRDARNREAAALLRGRWPALVRYKPGSDTEIRLVEPRPAAANR